MGLKEASEESPMSEVGMASEQSADEVTVGDLVRMYGKEPVRRAMKYMVSLSEADQSYRDSVAKERYKRNSVEGMAGEGAEVGAAPDKAADSWEEGVKEAGLGLGDEDE